jgi:hypothetical protein
MDLNPVTMLSCRKMLYPVSRSISVSCHPFHVPHGYKKGWLSTTRLWYSRISLLDHHLSDQTNVPQGANGTENGHQPHVQCDVQYGFLDMSLTVDGISIYCSDWNSGVTISLNKNPIRAIGTGSFRDHCNAVFSIPVESVGPRFTSLSTFTLFVILFSAKCKSW